MPVEFAIVDSFGAGVEMTDGTSDSNLAGPSKNPIDTVFGITRHENDLMAEAMKRKQSGTYRSPDGWFTARWGRDLNNWIETKVTTK